MSALDEITNRKMSGFPWLGNIWSKRNKGLTFFYSCEWEQKTKTRMHGFTASDTASEPWRAPHLRLSPSSLLALNCLTGVHARVCVHFAPIEGGVIAERIRSFGCKPRGNRKWQLSLFCLLTVEVEEAMWPIVRPIYTKWLESLAEVRGVRLNPPGWLFVLICSLNLFLSLSIHFLSPFQLHHPSVIPHSNTGKHTSAVKTQLSILKCYRAKKQCQIITLCESDPLSISCLPIQVLLCFFVFSSHRQVWDGALPVWGSVCGRLPRGLLPHPGEELPALLRSLPPLYQRHPLPQV